MNEQQSETLASPEAAARDNPRIYVASLSDYNLSLIHI